MSKALASFAILVLAATSLLAQAAFGSQNPPTPSVDGLLSLAWVPLDLMLP